MAELADALDSGSNFRKEVEVQVLLPAPPKSLENTEFSRLFVILFPLSHSGYGMHYLWRCVCRFFNQTDYCKLLSAFLRHNGNAV